MKYLLVLALFFTCFSISGAAHAGDLIVSRAMLEDKTGTLTIAEASAGEFVPSGPNLSKGVSYSAFWLRLCVKAPSKGTEVVLLINQPFLNEIRLYEPDAGAPEGWKTRVTGTLYPYAHRDRAKNSLGFVVNVKAPEEIYYLRVKTRSATQVGVQALEPAEADLKDSRLEKIDIFFGTSMLLLMLWAVHSYLLDRLPVVGLFAVHQATYALFSMAITGNLAAFMPIGLPQLVDWITAISHFAVLFTTLLFCRALFKPYRPPALMMRGINLLLLVFPLQLITMALGYSTVATKLNSALVMFIWLFFVVIAFRLRREQAPSRRILQIAFVVIALVYVLFWVASRSSQLTADSTIGRKFLISIGLLIGGIFAMVLNARSRRLQQEAQHSALELRARSEFLALVSHEIRTPLNALVGFSTLARTATDTSKLAQYHTIIEQSARSLMDLVNDILDMSKIEAGHMDVELVRFNLRRLLRDLTDQYRSLAELKKLSLKLDMAREVPEWVSGDPTRLRQVLANLLANAVKFTESGKVVCSVSVNKSEQNVSLFRFEVRDTGIGIPENRQPKLFRAFHQLDPSVTRKFGGTGLGLAIAQSLSAIMGGTIRVQSREGSGSCFIVELPLQASEPVVEQALEPVIRGSASVLVVEDNAFNRHLLRDILVAAGHQVMLAEDGTQALQIWQEHRFDLVLLDLRMPGIDGLEVARQIRHKENLSCTTHVPIVTITADPDTATVDACLAVGINEVLTKPIIPERLTRAIAEHCSAVLDKATDLVLSAQTHADFGDNPERAKQFREMLRCDILDELKKLRDAFDCHDRDALGRAAHSLKGLCGHLENRRAWELSVWLQKNASSSQWEQLGPVIEQLWSLCRFGAWREQDK